MFGTRESHLATHACCVIYFIDCGRWVDSCGCCSSEIITEN